MADETTRFQTAGPSWAERSALGELNAVIAPRGNSRTLAFLHAIHLVGAREVLRWSRKEAVVLDVGCGTGRFSRFFALMGRCVVGTEITPEMLAAFRNIGLPPRCLIVLTDGVSLPIQDRSIDIIWCCAVLRYSLFVPDPVYRDIADEMFRTVKHGGYVVNLEMYVDNQKEAFTRDFECAGFITEQVSILHRYKGWPERFCRSPLLPQRLLPVAGHLCATLRSLFDNPDRGISGLRDYMFVFRKPLICSSK